MEGNTRRQCRLVTQAFQRGDFGFLLWSDMKPVKAYLTCFGSMLVFLMTDYVSDNRINKEPIGIYRHYEVFVLLNKICSRPGLTCSELSQNPLSGIRFGKSSHFDLVKLRQSYSRRQMGIMAEIGSNWQRIAPFKNLFIYYCIWLIFAKLVKLNLKIWSKVLKLKESQRSSRQLCLYEMVKKRPEIKYIWMN